MKTYIAVKDLPTVKYIYSLGGGIKGRTVKRGDVVTVISNMTDIDTPTVCVRELLHRITASSFAVCFKPQ